MRERWTKKFKIIIIRYYDSRGGSKSIFKESKFNPGVRYAAAEKEGSYERNGNRRTALGLNMFVVEQQNNWIYFLVDPFW